MPLKDKEAKKAYMQEWRRTHNAYIKKYYAEHKEKIQAANKKCYTENRSARLQNRHRKRWSLKLRVLSYYSQGTLRCNSCGEEDIKVLQIDHVNGDGNEHRRTIGLRSGTMFYHWLEKQDYPKEFQVLCANCNLRKLYYERNWYVGD